MSGTATLITTRQTSDRKCREENSWLECDFS